MTPLKWWFMYMLMYICWKEWVFFSFKDRIWHTCVQPACWLSGHWIHGQLHSQTHRQISVWTGGKIWHRGIHWVHWNHTAEKESKKWLRVSVLWSWLMNMVHTCILVQIKIQCCRIMISANKEYNKILKWIQWLSTLLRHKQGVQGF